MDIILVCGGIGGAFVGGRRHRGCVGRGALVLATANLIQEAMLLVLHPDRLSLLSGRCDGDGARRVHLLRVAILVHGGHVKGRVDHLVPSVRRCLAMFVMMAGRSTTTISLSGAAASSCYHVF